MSFSSSAAGSGQFFHFLRQWHLYFGCIALVFLMVLSITGLAMLWSKPVDRYLNQHLYKITTVGKQLPISKQIDIIRASYSDYLVKLYLLPKSNSHSAQVVLSPKHQQAHSAHGGHGGQHLSVFINPHSGEILGELNPSNSLYNFVKNIHGTLMLGGLGDAIIEAIAGLLILMIVIGLLLQFSRRSKHFNNQSVVNTSTYSAYKLHRSIALIVALPMVLLLLSGLAWTNVWGGKIVQPWSTLPGTQFKSGRPESVSKETHESQSIEGIHPVPWATELKPLPTTADENSLDTDLISIDADRISIDTVAAMAPTLGFNRFRVHFPSKKSNVWTLSATTIAGDIVNPTHEKIVHISAITGEILREDTFSNYSWIAKAMAVFVPLHQGDLGSVNLVINSLICILIITMAWMGFKLACQKIGRRSDMSLVVSGFHKRELFYFFILIISALLFPLTEVVLVLCLLVIIFINGLAEFKNKANI